MMGWSRRRRESREREKETETEAHARAATFGRLAVVARSVPLSPSSLLIILLITPSSCIAPPPPATPSVPPAAAPHSARGSRWLILPRFTRSWVEWGPMGEVNPSKGRRRRRGGG